MFWSLRDLFSSVYLAKLVAIWKFYCSCLGFWETMTLFIHIESLKMQGERETILTFSIFGIYTHLLLLIVSVGRVHGT
jgi:hypothetical protein